ncbi:MAG: selenide, water dikinase SelD, partial [Verrucomicrobiae bacterium]|nr:selenide, water dikinase SelD [Verrucomicrobiae bacterium]
MTPPVRLTQFSSGAGCGCKISPQVLDRILSAAGAGAPDDRLLVGNDHRDDAAAYALDDGGTALLATTDFFMPIVDNPFHFGAIAATNALSDVYAMGGKPLFALALVAMPIDKLAPEVIREILAGGESVCRAAGIPIAGGHSIDSVEPIYGLVAIGS